METSKIAKSIYITASLENVWKVLTEDFYTRQWYAEFSEGAFTDTDWQEGSKVVFSDASKSGLLGRVVSFKPGQKLIVEYIGILKNGVEDYDSFEAKALQGGLEIYRLSYNNGFTHLEITGDMAPQMLEIMSASWDRAVEKIRMLAEMRQVQ